MLRALLSVFAVIGIEARALFNSACLVVVDAMGAVLARQRRWQAMARDIQAAPCRAVGRSRCLRWPAYVCFKTRKMRSRSAAPAVARVHVTSSRHNRRGYRGAARRCAKMRNAPQARTRARRAGDVDAPCRAHAAPPRWRRYAYKMSAK